MLHLRISIVRKEILRTMVDADRHRNLKRFAFVANRSVICGRDDAGAECDVTPAKYGDVAALVDLKLLLDVRHPGFYMITDLGFEAVDTNFKGNSLRKIGAFLKKERKLIVPSLTTIACASITATVALYVALHRNPSSQQGTVVTAFVPQPTTQSATTQAGPRPDAGTLAKDAARVESAVRPYIVTTDGRHVPLTDDLLKAAKDLAEYGNLEQRIIGKIASKDSAGADLLIQQYKKLAGDQEFKALMFEGNNRYLNNDSDNAIDSYAAALKLHPDDFWAATGLAAAHLTASSGNIEAHCLAAIEIEKKLLGRVPQGSADWATTMNNQGVAWAAMP